MLVRMRCLSLCVIMALVVGNVWGVPNLINLQGRLTDDVGTPVADGDYSLRFSIFNVASGGAELWNSGGYVPVTVTGGLYSTMLGSSTPLPSSLGDEDSLWVEIQLEGSSAFSPRVRLTSGIWALHTRYADTADVALGGMDGWVDDGATVRLTTPGDAVGIGTATPGLKLTVKDHGAQTGLEIDSPMPTIRLIEEGVWKWDLLHEGSTDKLHLQSSFDATPVLTIDSDGDLGLGDDDPYLQLSMKTTGQNGIQIDNSMPTIRFIENGVWKWDLLHQGSTDKLHLVSNFDPTPIVTIDSDGDMGLGDDDPYLQLSMKTTGQNGIQIDNSMPTIRFIENGVWKWDLLHQGSTDKLHLVSNFDPTPIVTIDSDGDMGLGDDNPYLQLSMKTTGQNGIQIDNSMPTIRFIENGVWKWDLLHQGSTDKLHLISNFDPTPILTVDGDGDLGLGDDDPYLQFSMKTTGQNGIEIDNSMPTIRFTENGATKWDLLHYGATDKLLLVSYSTGNEVLSFDASDNMGIGTDDALTTAHVQGSNIDLPATAFQADKLVVEDPDAVLGLYSGAGGAAGSAVSLGEVTAGALVDKWGIVRETNSGGKGLRFTYGTSADQFSNTTILYLNDNGQVGVGTTATEERLHVENSGSAGNSFIRVESSHPSNWGECGLRIETPDNRWHLRMDDDSHNNLPVAGSLALRSQNSGKELMTWTDGGYVGINRTNPAEALHVVGNICYTGSIGACSDARYKENVETLSGALDKLAQLRGVEFNWKRDEFRENQFGPDRQIGFIAQELLDVLPEVVNQGRDGYYTVDYARLTPLLVEAVKELQSTNQELLERLASLEELVYGGHGIENSD